MKITLRTPKQALNKAYLKEKVIRSEFDLFKKNLNELIEKTRIDESEEHSKTPLINFLKDTYYKDTNEINTKDKIDLVIYNDKTSKSSAGVLFEVKKSSNTGEMITKSDLNKKAFHELMLYYLRERIEEKNIDIKFIIATNIYEWFIFDSADFERLFYKNSKLVKDYNEWNTKQKVTQNTDLFYNDIAKPFLSDLDEEIKCTWFDIRDYKIDSSDKDEEKKLIPLYKIFSQAHLLKQPFANDSNRLDRAFYNELLHIIGLEETKDKNKKIITRKSKERRDPGSFIENTILMLKTEDRLPKVTNIVTYGKDKEERLFNVALELNITWINRILFLKLLESQLYKYHNGNKSYKFLNITSIKDFDVLNKLFFQVLAVKDGDRNKVVKNEFGLIPYLNSSLFEINQLEDETIRINTLEDDLEIPVHSSTVLKENNKRLKGSMPALKYLFEFLEAYDFTSEGKEEIQEENKTLINASVLGLIFEKINGYKDGSFFTPGFITMYMCRETIRRAVVQKFNDKYEWKCEEFDDLYNHLTGKNTKDIKEYNEVINSLTLCDPAVGSGHFLVSALNEIIAVKSELGILADEKGKVLKDYDLKIENDELIVTSHQGTELFEYTLNNDKPHEEIQRVQKTLFHEKQTIIENSLFGVDINQNSVKIARLRLWIELLKNAYYTEESGFKELETLPNIDINIKEGNSLISRFPIDTDLKQVLKTIKWKVEDYRKLVYEYKNEHNKEKKRAVKKLIDDIKNNFRTEISSRDPRVKKLGDLTYELHNKYQTERLIDIEMSDKDKEKLKKEEKKLVDKIEKLSAEIKEIEEGEIYRNAFEWRFEFPEVLADNGDYIGFDVVIGNPPYIRSREKFDEQFKNIMLKQYTTASYQLDLYKLFIERGTNLLNKNNILCFITPSVFLTNDYDSKLRKYLLEKYSIGFISEPNSTIFEEANVVVTIFLIFAKNKSSKINLLSISNKDIKEYGNVNQDELSEGKFIINTNLLSANNSVITKLNKIGKIHNYFVIKNGIKVRKELLSNVKKNKNYKPFLLGKHIRPYSMRESDIFIHYKKENENLYTNQAFRDPDIFEQPKLIIRQIPSDRIISYFDKENYFTDQTTYLIIHPEKNTKYLKILQGILSSKLIWYYFKNTVFDNKDLFPKVKRSQLLELPLILNDSPIQMSLLLLVSSIIKQKEVNPDINIEHLESQIDILVYKLYELTYEEVKVVQPDFVLTKNQYENYKIDR